LWAFLLSTGVVPWIAVSVLIIIGLYNIPTMASSNSFSARDSNEVASELTHFSTSLFQVEILFNYFSLFTVVS